MQRAKKSFFEEETNKILRLCSDLLTHYYFVVVMLVARTLVSSRALFVFPSILVTLPSKVSRRRFLRTHSSSSSSSSSNNNSSGSLCAHNKMNREELQNLSCKLNGGCSSTTPKLSEEEIEKLLAEYPLWRREGAMITRKFTAKNWQCAADFFSQLSSVAEEEGHHPDFKLFNYREVQVDLTTHAIGALSMYDFILAAKIDKIPVIYSPKWKRENIKE